MLLQALSRLPAQSPTIRVAKMENRDPTVQEARPVETTAAANTRTVRKDPLFHVAEVKEVVAVAATTVKARLIKMKTESRSLTRIAPVSRTKMALSVGATAVASIRTAKKDPLSDVAEVKEEVVAVAATTVMVRPISKRTESRSRVQRYLTRIAPVSRTKMALSVETTAVASIRTAKKDPSSDVAEVKEVVAVADTTVMVRPISKRTESRSRHLTQPTRIAPVSKMMMAPSVDAVAVVVKEVVAVVATTTGRTPVLPNMTNLLQTKRSLSVPKSKSTLLTSGKHTVARTPRSSP
jgi:hypothetical protein